MNKVIVIVNNGRLIAERIATVLAKELLGDVNKKHLILCRSNSYLQMYFAKWITVSWDFFGLAYVIRFDTEDPDSVCVDSEMLEKIKTEVCIKCDICELNGISITDEHDDIEALMIDEAQNGDEAVLIGRPDTEK
ncbi:hypothetical protein ACFLY0_00725 [Patescibacteria group bacterium]